MKRLEWSKLFSEERCRQSGSKKMDEKKGIVVRNAFEQEYDRIVGSSSVRRLQDKAQVFPLQKNDVVRTRLTHSMEVSALARSLGKAVGIKLEESGEFVREDTEKLCALLQTAGLIHDLGNPPFGHYGEQVIQKWVEDKKNELGFKDQQELEDFLCFDGNVQNLRIVAKLQTMNDSKGANFTYATLATIMKYPYCSVNRSNKETDADKRKFGYFKSEEHIVSRIRKATGLEEGVRHPATYLLEAADDIIYLGDDIEDGVKKGCIVWDSVWTKCKEFCEKNEKYKELFRQIENNKPDINMEESEKVLAKVRVLRNYIQGYLFESAVKVFLSNYDKIMCGEFNSDLLDDEKELVKMLKDITAKNCFSCREVLALEIAGDRVLTELLEILYRALKDAKEKDVEKTKTYAGKIYQIISANYKYIALYDYKKECKRGFDSLTIYDKLHLIIDFVSGMTDSYAVSLYKELTGINLPE